VQYVTLKNERGQQIYEIRRYAFLDYSLLKLYLVEGGTVFVSLRRWDVVEIGEEEEVKD